MRIVITNTNLRLAGGIEIYLDTIIPAICEAGHEIALLGKMDGPVGRAGIGMYANVPVWCLSGMGAPSAFRELKAWRPDLIYAQGLDEPMLDAEALAVAPNVFFAHGYHGTCISGGKSFSYPVARPCVRQFGWQCFAHFYPHRCGGLNFASGDPTAAPERVSSDSNRFGSHAARVSQARLCRKRRSSRSASGLLKPAQRWLRVRVASFTIGAPGRWLAPRNVWARPSREVQ